MRAAVVRQAAIKAFFGRLRCGEQGTDGQIYTRFQARLLAGLTTREKLGERGGEEDRHYCGHGRSKRSCVRIFSEEQGTYGFRLDGASAEGDDGLFCLKSIGSEGAGDDFRFEAAEVGFAMVGEDFGDGEALACRDDGVDVVKGPVKARRQQAADRGLAGSHEAGKDDATRKSLRPEGASGHFALEPFCF